MKHLKLKKAVLFVLVLAPAVFVSCGYRMVGSRPLPFSSVTIKPIVNRTYEPKLEDRLHRALSREFIAQGIKVKAADGDITLASTILSFRLHPIASVEDMVQEQEITFTVNVRVMDNGNVMEFTSMESPIRITFRATGTVPDTVVKKERSTDKACSEIAREIISRIIVRYAE